MGKNPRTAAWGPADVLSSTRLFGALTPAELRRIARSFEPVAVAGGTTLLRKGEPADAVYLVVTGRLRAFASGPDGETALDDMVPGDVVGELALLTDRPRSATVRAVRDSQLLRLTTSDFDEVVARHPQVLRHLAAAMVERVADRLELPPPSPKRVTNITVVPAGRTSAELLDETARSLAEALGAVEPTAVVSSKDVEAALGAGAAESNGSDRRSGEVLAWLHALEERHELVVHVADPTATEWTRRCLRQADRILWVASGGDTPDPGPVEVRTADTVASVGTRQDLALVHEPGTHPLGTAAWLDVRNVTAHHHLRRGHRPDHSRVARHLTGRAVGLVCGGGGPRGYAHLGVTAALEEAGIPIDAVGGTSIGAVFAAGPALGWDAATRRERAVRLSRTRRLIGPTLPVVSLSSGRRLTSLLHSNDLFGDVRIEDLWLPYFCISANLSTAESVVHERGPLWRAVRASISLPGILPPVFEDGDLLVDGGVVNDLPVDVMQERIGPNVVAVDLQPEVDLRTTQPFDLSLSGWRVMARRLNPWAPSYDVPHTLAVLMRAKEIAGRRAQRDALDRRPAAVYLRPPTDGFDALDFKAATELIDVGYRYATDALARDAAAALLPRNPSVDGRAPTRRRPLRAARMRQGRGG